MQGEVVFLVIYIIAIRTTDAMSQAPSTGDIRTARHYGSNEWLNRRVKVLLVSRRGGPGANNATSLKLFHTRGATAAKARTILRGSILYPRLKELRPLNVCQVFLATMLEYGISLSHMQRCNCYRPRPQGGG